MRSLPRSRPNHAQPNPEPLRQAAHFEAEFPAGWGHANGEVVHAAEAPQGKAYFQMKAKKNAGVRSPVLAVEPGVPCFLSYWINTPAWMVM